MKVSILLLGIFVCSCQASFTNTDSAQDTKMKKDTIVRPDHVSHQAKLINLGFVDAPVYVWIEYIGNYIENGKVYNHIHGIKHTYNNANFIDTAYYEHDEGRTTDTIKNRFKGFKIIPYPGDGTYKLIDGNDSLLLFNVMQLSDSRQMMKGKEWQMGVPTTRINHNGEKVSGAGTHVHLEKENSDIYLVSLIDDKGMRTLRFQKFGNCMIDTELSYLDKQEGKLYFVSRDCYLKILEKSDLPKL